MDNEKHVLALGFFDGVHRGHFALLKRTVEIAKERGLIPSVITFDTHPMAMVMHKTVPLINSEEDRAGLIRSIFGIDDIVFLHFDETTMRMPWEQFIKDIVDGFGAAHLVCGHDYSFGYRGEGTPERLKSYCEEHGLGCDVIPPVMCDGIRISSTIIRELILDGEMEKACEYLGHAHVLTDVVRVGRRLGRTIDAPTINMHFRDGIIVPRYGVYATEIFLGDGSVHFGVTNIGVRPTVDTSDLVTAETHILDYGGNLYGKRVRVRFYKFMRPEQKFADVDELKKQIHADAEATRAYFAANPPKWPSGPQYAPRQWD
ncbi:MAG: riboflavin biosynthesis protein RibF [Oscillospiraceae bacterium]|nr:riboflavin biosynthesis protein RibF [Oscillospiraceae bacterium]